MAGEDAVYDTAFKRAGIVRMDTIQDLFDCAELMAKQSRPRGPRMAIVTNGGGTDVTATDPVNDGRFISCFPKHYSSQCSMRWLSRTMSSWVILLRLTS
jgi:hypothetical protein